MALNSGEDYRAFPATRWTLVARAGADIDAPDLPALDELLRLYHPALRAHLVLRKKIPPERADDLLQGFMASKILSGHLLGAANQQFGRFRTYLLTALDRYIVSVIRHENAQKRSPGAEPVLNVDNHPDLGSVPDRTAAEFDVAWARQVVAETLRRVQTECVRSGRETFWQVFDLRIVGPLLDGVAPPAYEELVQRFGFASPTQASNALLTAKRMFARLLREVVTEYARDAATAEAEIQELRAILAEAGA